MFFLHIKSMVKQAKYIKLQISKLPLILHLWLLVRMMGQVECLMIYFGHVSGLGVSSTNVPVTGRLQDLVS